MKWLSVSMVYVGFFGLIAFAVWWTGSAVPMWALLLTPECSTSARKDTP